MTEGNNVDLREILTLIPHRYPFLLVDRVVGLVPGHSGVGIKNVTVNEPFFPGHFPGNPVMPGVLIIEAMAQTAAVVVGKSMEPVESGKQRQVFFMSIDGARFRKPVLPGDQLELHMTKDRSRGEVWKFKGEAKVEGVLVAEAICTAMVRAAS